MCDIILFLCVVVTGCCRAIIMYDVLCFHSCLILPVIIGSNHSFISFIHPVFSLKLTLSHKTDWIVPFAYTNMMSHGGESE